MLLLQAMMALPIFIIPILVMMCGVIYLLLRTCNAIWIGIKMEDADRATRKAARKRSRRLHFYIALVAGLLWCIYFVCVMLNSKDLIN